jgi:hypothetical protein
MYPVEDTIDENYNLNGFHDSLFFNINIYNINNKTVYKSKMHHDGISILIPCETRYFKDLSLMLIFTSGISIIWGQKLFISEVD